MAANQITPPASGVVGRLAPSPTGHLHLGNAWAFLLAWLACRQAGGTLLLRLEDIDPDRSTDAYARDLMDDLRWIGLFWDGEPVIQSTRHGLYEAAIARLTAQGQVYPCYCTRRDLREQLQQLAGAPHVDDRGAPYPGTCRILTPEERRQREAAGRRPCLRFNTQGLAAQVFTDAVYGPQCFSLDECGGDFALRRSDGVFAYQLAVVVDDGLCGVTQVVRGHDILVSTPRQLALQTALGLPHPTYAHIPLLCDAQGERLAKRHASLTLRALRGRGISPEQIIGFLGFKAGFLPAPAPVTPADLIGSFNFQQLAMDRVCFHEQELLVGG